MARSTGLPAGQFRAATDLPTTRQAGWLPPCGRMRDRTQAEPRSGITSPPGTKPSVKFPDPGGREDDLHTQPSTTRRAAIAQQPLQGRLQYVSPSIRHQTSSAARSMRSPRAATNRSRVRLCSSQNTGGLRTAIEDTGRGCPDLNGHVGDWPVEGRTVSQPKRFRHHGEHSFVRACAEHWRERCSRAERRLSARLSRSLSTVCNPDRYRAGMDQTVCLCIGSREREHPIMPRFA